MKGVLVCPGPSCSKRERQSCRARIGRRVVSNGRRTSSVDTEAVADPSRDRAASSRQFARASRSSGQGMRGSTRRGSRLRKRAGVSAGYPPPPLLPLIGLPHAPSHSSVGQLWRSRARPFPAVASASDLRPSSRCAPPACEAEVWLRSCLLGGRGMEGSRFANHHCARAQVCSSLLSAWGSEGMRK